MSVSSTSGALAVFGFAGLPITAKSARVAKRNPENPTNPINPDSDKNPRAETTKIKTCPRNLIKGEKTPAAERRSPSVSPLSRE